MSSDDYVRIYGMSSDDYVRSFVVELIRAGSLLADLLDELLDATGAEDLPDDALIEMLTGTLRPVVEAAGEAPVRRITPLFDACVERTLGDLGRALELARATEHGARQ